MHKWWYFNAVFLLGVHCGSVYLSDKVEDFILRHVQSLVYGKIDEVIEILSMEADVLETFLEHLVDQCVIFGVICGWTLFDASVRKEDLGRLLTKFSVPEVVRLEVLSEAVDAEEFCGNTDLLHHLKLAQVFLLPAACGMFYQRVEFLILGPFGPQT